MTTLKTRLGDIEAADALAASQRRYQDEYEIVDRVWKALGITTYEGANGKAIHEIVAEQKAALAAAKKEAKHHCEVRVEYEKKFHECQGELRAAEGEIERLKDELDYHKRQRNL